jgi:hypothetical protein
MESIDHFDFVKKYNLGVKYVVWAKLYNYLCTPRLPKVSTLDTKLLMISFISLAYEKETKYLDCIMMIFTEVQLNMWR